MSENQPQGNPSARRSVRSFVLRKGRLTPAQKQALDRLWPRYGIDSSSTLLDLEAVFGCIAPLTVEIGFGNGDALAELAQLTPQEHFIGIEVHPPGIGHLLRLLESRQLENVRVASGDAVGFIEERLADAAVAGFRVWFPDPWPKKRHHKRRLIQPGFVQLLVKKLQPGGVIHLATDWAPYAEHMLEVLSAESGLRNLSGSDDFCERPDWRPLTRFECRGERLGHETRDLLFEKREEFHPDSRQT